VTLYDRLKSAPTKGLKGCSLGKILQALDVKDREALQAALLVPYDSDDRISNAEMARVLQDEGYDVKAKTVETHRRGGCGCGASRATK